MMQTRSVVAGGTVFLLREEGSGDGVPVVLLHGVPETSACWHHLAPRLAGGRRVLAPDLPGLGGSTFTGPYDVRTLVGELVALLDAEGLDQVDLVGHDWGGILALGLAGLHPERVRRLVVANAPYVALPTRAYHVPLLALPVLPELVFRLGGGRVVDLMLRAAWRSDTVLDPEVRAEYRAAYTGRAAVRAMLGYYRAAARPVVRGRRDLLPPVTTDGVVVLWGALDPVLPISTGETVVRDLGPSAQMVTVPGSGHFVLEEAPEVTGDVLVAALA